LLHLSGANPDKHLQALVENMTFYLIICWGTFKTKLKC